MGFQEAAAGGCYPDRLSQEQRMITIHTRDDAGKYFDIITETGNNGGQKE
ncbi:MAG: hypothetical protein SWH68_11245 [Thermodesulfobacteriota bacterium]|nr:hypothetical protein [Thermodesulfobacteriota bacterium]